MQTLRWIIAAVVFVALVYLSLQNAAVVELTFFNFAALKAPLIVVVFVAFAAGVAIGLLAGALRAARLKRQITRLRREHREGDPGASMPGGAVPGTTPASGPGFTRNDHMPDGL